MSLNRNGTCAHLVTTSLERLSEGVDKMLSRWSGANKPSKLTLLNDLAAAIRPGANWGALKFAASPISQLREDHAALIPSPPRGAHVLPARLFPIACEDDQFHVTGLAAQSRALFSMRHNDDPILGLDLTVVEGNGDIDVLTFARLILLSENGVESIPVDAHEMNSEVARLVYCAVQNLIRTPIYPAFAQTDCSMMHVLLGPFSHVLAIPDGQYRSASRELPSQGVRVLIDEKAIPRAGDLDTSLRLLAAVIPSWEVEGFPSGAPVRFQLSQQRERIWVPVDFQVATDLDDRPIYRRDTHSEWMHEGDFIGDSDHQYPLKISEAVDLALALIDVDDPDVFLHVELTPQPSRKRSSRLAPGWRGGLVKSWRILRLGYGLDAKVLTLDAESTMRLRSGLNGWAMREGYSIEEVAPQYAIEALIPRAQRRASHHLEQVRAIMDGADPLDQELMESLEITS